MLPVSDLSWASQNVQMYSTFVSGLRHLPTQMKNQHGLNEEKTFIEKNVTQLSFCDVTRVVIWILTT
jgi:hypothetical protein